MNTQPAQHTIEVCLSFEDWEDEIFQITVAADLPPEEIDAIVRDAVYGDAPDDSPITAVVWRFVEEPPP